MKKDNRLSLVMRLQPTVGTPLGEVVDWLKSMSSHERKEKITEVLIMSFLAYARETKQQDLNSVENCYWDTQNRLNQYAYVMRQKLGIRGIQPVTDIFSSESIEKVRKK